MKELVRLFSDLFAGNTELHILAREPHQSKNRAAIQELIKAGADVTARNRMGCMPLHIAILNADRAPKDTAITLYSFISRDTVDLLMAPPADVNAKDNKGNTPLHYAVQKYRNDLHPEYMPCLLVGRGADPNIRNESGMTPLHLAVTCSLTTAKKLILSGADIDIKDNSGKTPQYYTKCDLRYIAEHRQEIIEEEKYDYY